LRGIYVPHDPPSPDTERRVADRARGDATRSPSHAADLDRLFDAHRGQIYRLCLGWVGDPARAEELVQETLLTAYERLPEYDPDRRFQTWIFGIARNHCRNAARKRRELLTEDGVVEPDDVAASALSRLREQERSRLLHEASVAALDAREQEAVHLRYVEGLSQDRITALMGLEGSGARGLLQRCRRKLGRELKRRLAELGHGESFIQKTR